MIKTISTIVILAYSLQLFSQETAEKVVVENNKGNHRATIGMGHTHLSKGKNVEGKTVWLSQPSWSLNYDFWLSQKWAIGLQTDLVLEKFIVEGEDGQELERDKPLALIAVALFKPWKHFSLIGGGGVELEKEESLALTRFGIEYGAELPKNWEAGIAVVWDAKWGHYDSWGLEFSFSKIFRKGKK